MAEPSWYDFLIPSEETREAIVKGIEAGKRDVRILKDEGPEALELRRKEEEFLNLGHDDDTAAQLAKDAIDNDKRFRIIPKDINFIGDAKASTIDTEETETEEVKDIKTTDKVGLGDKDDYEVGLGQSLTGAVVSAGIKFPKGIINFGTLVYDAAKGDGIDVDESLTERFNRGFDKTIFGLIENQAEEDARSTAAGHLTEAFLQIFNAAKVGTKVLGPGIQYASRKARELAPALVKAIKTNRYAKLDDTATAVTKAGSKAKQLNKPNRFDKFAAVSIGGGFGGGAIVMKSEDIGTFGDINALEFLGTGLDRKQKEDANEDAFRQLNNKFKFSAELAFPIVPFVYGTAKTAKLLATKGKDLAFSNSQIERWVDKYVGKPFRSRSDKAQELFDGIQNLEGTKSAVKITADDAARSFDDALKKISRNSTKASEAIQNPAQLSELFSNFLLTTDDVVSKGRILFKGFSNCCCCS